jgi:predicted DNA-binding transcriptional regulator AlpA
VVPRGLNRVTAAFYVGVSVGKFDEMVRDGLMPQPKTVGTRLIWDKHRIDSAFEELPDRGDPNEWNDT